MEIDETPAPRLVLMCDAPGHRPRKVDAFYKNGTGNWSPEAKKNRNRRDLARTVDEHGEFYSVERDGFSTGDGRGWRSSYTLQCRVKSCPANVRVRDDQKLSRALDEIEKLGLDVLNLTMLGAILAKQG